MGLHDDRIRAHHSVWVYHRKNKPDSFYLGTLEKTGGYFFYLNDPFSLRHGVTFHFSYEIEEYCEERVFPWEMFI